MKGTVFSIFLFLLAPFALLSAQTRDNAAPAVARTSEVSGVVLSDDADPKPLHHVLVQLASGGLSAPEGAMTNDKGEFAFLNIPAGTYSLSASRAGYVPAFYGAKTQGRGPGVPIAVGVGQHVSGITVKMLHGGVITGAVHLANGRPAAGVDISALDVKTVNGHREAQMNLTMMAAVASAANGDKTDDRGQYRVYGLPPGDYVVIARVNGLENAALGSLTGGTESSSTTAADVEWARQVTASPGTPLTPAPPAGQSFTYAPVFYPGTTDIATAGVISLGPNEERGGVDFNATPVSTATVSGTVIDPDGRPAAGASVSLKSTRDDVLDPASVVASLFGTMNATGPDGTFTLRGITPGAYTLEVRAADRRGAPAGGANAPAAAGGAAALLGLLSGAGGGSRPTLWASDDVSVNGVDIGGLTLALQPGMTVSGKVVFEGTTAPPKDMKQVRVVLVPVGSGTSQMAQVSAVTSMVMGTASDDGTFSVTGVTPNTYRVQVIAPGMMLPTLSNTTGWVLRSVMAGDRDVADTAMDVRPGEQVSGLVATFTDRPTELSGTILDRDGKPLSSFPLVVFSTDRAFWIPQSRRVAQGRPSQDGKYKITGLPAGEYYVTAVTDLDPNDLYDPSFLETLVPSAFKITIGDGEKKVQDLKLAGR